jgi:hypothetical protein
MDEPNRVQESMCSRSEECGLQVMSDEMIMREAMLQSEQINDKIHKTIKNQQ